MSLWSCPEGTLLVANIAEALRRQCELPAHPTSQEELALEREVAEAVKAASRHASQHLASCPVCRAPEFPLRPT